MLAPGADLARVRAGIRAVLPAALAVDTLAQRKADIGRVIGALSAMLGAISLIGLIAAFLIASNRLSGVFERRLGDRCPARRAS